MSHHNPSASEFVALRVLVDMSEQGGREGAKDGENKRTKSKKKNQFGADSQKRAREREREREVGLVCGYLVSSVNSSGLQE